MRRPKVGDVFEIPLSTGRKAYGRYLMMSKVGPIIQVYSIIANESISLDKLITANDLFPPIITGLFAAIKTGLWRIIGNIPIKGDYHPNFIGTNFTPEGKATNWYYWNGDKYQFVGTVLPEEFKKMEFLIGWNPPDVAERIESGEIPFPFGELIKDNMFTPRE